MAIEALHDPRPRTGASLGHVEQLLALTKQATIDAHDKASILGSLRWLKSESIRQTGLRLVTERLGDRQYGGLGARDFFDYCYNLRSSLAHGASALPEYGKVGAASASLEVMVSDLLAGRLRDFNLSSRVPG